MKRKMMLTVVCLLLAVLLAFSGCAVSTASQGDLMAGLRPRKPQGEADLKGPGADASAEFGLDLLRLSLQAEPEENALFSPLSVLNALAMTAGGASGETLAQMEEAFGLPVGELREWLAAYSGSLPSSEKASFHQANSIWLREGALEVEKDFLQQNADYFGAGVYEKSFTAETLRELNGWVEEHTHKMIPSILDELSPQAVMVLVNALAFEGEWQEIYDEYDVRERTFTQEDGTETAVDMMYSTETRCLQDGEGLGFLKPYAGGEYAFAALLPPEGMALEDYLNSLTGQRLREVLTGAEERDVWAAIPKFQAGYSTFLEGVLMEMGMTDAFDPARADFTQMGRTVDNDPLYVSKVVHKTYISVYEQGTKAGAATAVLMEAGSAMLDEPIQVYLDRPFLYMIVDTETCTPIFLGAMYTPGSAEK